MDWLASILTSPNSWITILGLIILVCLLAHFSKKGLIAYKGKGLSVGTADNERTIVRQQIEYTKTAIEIMTNQLISTFKSADEWRVRYICELIYDVYIEAISFNHITKDSFYIETKADKIWAIIQRETVTTNFKNDEFKRAVYDECKKVIEKLVDIKEYYSKS